MRRLPLTVLATVLLSLSFGEAIAQTLPPAKKPAAVRCRDAKGKIVKCTAAGAVPEGSAASASTAPAPAATTASKPSVLKGLFAKKPEANASAPTQSASAPTAGQVPSSVANPPAPRAKKPSSGPKAPSAASTDPTGATAKCKDGSYWHSKTHAGSCSHHGGVASFL